MANYENQENDRQENRYEESINTKDFIIGCLIGGMVGAATALFLAPKSGKEIRDNINHGAHSLKDRTSQWREAAVHKGTELADVAKEKTNVIGKNVSKQSHEIINKVKGLTVSDGKGQADEADQGADIQQKLEETKRAFDETESQLNEG
ncbi:YtxH domain-containing protein [Bacillus dakarensis]|uniref:YtxH domain-containing protein n=1 Tax=Robertmurraya dakarensis TaxID=1926278 RepID=UPI0009822C51|nr:YtxH domain-containing protein [Bacillus dakarensis]